MTVTDKMNDCARTPPRAPHRPLRAGMTAAALAAALLGAAPAHAGDALARSKNCLACHQVDVKRVGPAYAEVAKRYAGQSDAEQHLADAIRKGGRGRWGAIPMPSQPQVNEAEAHELARWILSLKP